MRVARAVRVFRRNGRARVCGDGFIIGFYSDIYL
jgi:hypothetical protein